MVTAEEEQTTLLDLGHKSLNAYWVDPQQPLIIPNNPLHWRAHELQLLLEILKKQAAKNPAQFNSKNYIDTLNAYTDAINDIKKGKSVDEVLDEGRVAEVGDDSATPPVGARVSSSMGTRVSADNPLAG